MDAEVAGTDRSSWWPLGTSVSRWLAGGARRLIRACTMPGGDAIAWPAGLCYVGWLAGVLVSGQQPHLLRTIAEGTLVALPAVVVASHAVTAVRQHGPWRRRAPADHARIEDVRDPRISELLGRRPVSTGVEAVAGRFAGRRILVTGAAARSAQSSAVSCISSLPLN